MTNKNEPANPAFKNDFASCHQVPHMTLLDWFAGRALSAWITADAWISKDGPVVKSR